VINFKSIPFFKILFPFLIGIISAFYFGLFQNLHVVFLFGLVLWTILFLVQKYYVKNVYFIKGLYILFTNLFLFILAFESCFLYNAKNNNSHYSHFVRSEPQSFIATINDIPVVTEKFIKLSVEVNCIESNNTWHYAQGNTIIYVKNDSILKPTLGSTVFVNSKFSYVNEPKNPNEFDYKTFLENKNVFHTAYIKSEELHVVSQTNNLFSIIQLGAKIKAHLVMVLRNSGLSQEAFSICSALLVGYDDEIDSDIMQSFSHSGTLHILSVSGMHTGVLYGILIFIFSIFDKHDKYKKTKFCFVMIFLLMFVFITGLSPSVLRAALMLSLVLFGKTFYKQGNSYNTLLLSAFLLLLFNPYLIKDVGFLLSYFAVFGIMYFYPILNKLYSFENKILQWLWTSVLISVAATLFTLPISLYFFHQFPIWFVFSNLIIIPISMFIMLGAFLLVLLYKIVFINQILIYIINGATSVMLWFAKLTDSPKYGFVDFISFSIADLVFLSLIIFFGLIIISTKQYKQVIALCFAIILWLSVSIYSNYEQIQNKELIVFHVKQKSVFALRVGQSIYANFNDITEKEFQRFIKPYLLTISNLKVIHTKSSFLKYASTSILNVNQTTLFLPQLNSNYIVVSNDSPLELTTNYKTKPLIIADCSNSYKFVKKLKKQCALLDLPFCAIKESGALQIKL
jgi:competence protein ComEC